MRMKSHGKKVFVALWFVVLGCGLSPQKIAAQNWSDRFEQNRGASLALLRQALQEGDPWVKVHAAEFLLLHNYPTEVRNAFAAELEKQPSPPYRIGVWRVLVRAAGNNREQRDLYFRWIIAAAADTDGPDTEHAIEALAKLGSGQVERGAVDSTTATLQAYARWANANSGTEDAESFLLDLLDSADPSVRSIVGYGIRHLDGIGENSFARLQRAVLKEPADSAARVYLLSALYVHAHARKQTDLAEDISDGLLHYLASARADEKKEVCSALAACGNTSSLDCLVPLLSDPDLDVQIHAANACLRIERRQFRGLQWLDWVLICTYAAFLLGIGVYCARRQTNTEEYFLGGRGMNSFLVGISMFASLLSTISYLGDAGEIIKHGPMILTGLLAVPFAYIVIGYILIPRIMKSRITSAYEILEYRLGVEVSLLGSVIFITTRMVWMGLLVYLSARLIVETLNWEQGMVPWVIVAAGTIAVVYTAVGGLRAVVIADFFQSIILLSGALITLTVITIKMGGLGWFPTEWAPHWDRQPMFSWNPSVRVTVVGTLIFSFLSWICNAGSDQMTIQRCLATRDAQAARRAFLTHTVFGLFVDLMLYTVGFALLGLFLLNRHLVPDGKSMIADADFLFPRFIANYLPLGLAGLVIAGLFAAAMSSVDSGINSTVTVISRDFVDRWRKKKNGEADSAINNISLAKWLTLLIGIVVVLLGTQAGRISGNIVEVVFKTMGLFTGPLFGLFYMAMFARKATPLGAIAGTAYGLATGVVIAFWDELTGAPQTLSFQWIIPCSLTAQLSIGWLVSRFCPECTGRAVSVATLLLPLVLLFAGLWNWGIQIATYLQWGISQ